MISPESFLDKLDPNKLKGITKVFVMRHETIRFSFKEGYFLDINYKVKNGKVMYLMPPNNWIDEDQMVEQLRSLGS